MPTTHVQDYVKGEVEVGQFRLFPHSAASLNTGTTLFPPGAPLSSTSSNTCRLGELESSDYLYV